MENLTSKIADCLLEGDSMVLATIMSHKGSTPRTSGSLMAVFKDKQVIGTIGGGLVEAKVIETSMELMESQKSRIVHFALNKDIKDGLDMVCGGDLIVFLESLVPDDTVIELFKKAVRLEANRTKGFWVRAVTDGNSRTVFKTQKAIVLADGTSYGNPVLPKTLTEGICDNRFSGNSPVLFHHGLEEFIITPIQIRDTLFIFGAGHVGFRLAQMADLIDFNTVIIDDREEFANSDRFPTALAVHVVDDFQSAFDNLIIDDHSYIVILTRGHLHDQTVLEGALKQDAAYVGMIGSKPKRNQIYRNLKEKGISQKALEKVYSPIGLEIKAETPAEIAVSILGQIIEKRAGQ